MKRSALKRKTPLRTLTPGLKRSRLAPMSAKRKAGIEDRRDVRMAVFARDGYRCRLEGVESAGGCMGGLTFHHLLKASACGPYTEDNGVTLCVLHNDWVECNVPEATALGLVRR